MGRISFGKMILSLVFLAGSLFLGAEPYWHPLDPSARPGTPCSVSVLEDTDRGLKLEITVPGLWFEEIVREEETYTILSVSGAGSLYEEGKPALPVWNGLVKVPDLSPATLEIAEAETLPLSGILPYPAQPQIYRDEAPPISLARDPVCYASAEPFPSDRAGFAVLGQLRDDIAGRISVPLVRCRPASRTLEAVRHLVLTLSFANPAPALSAWEAFVPRASVSAGFFLNRAEAPSALSLAPSAPAPETYLILTHPAAMPALADFTTWKRQLGFHVVVQDIAGVGTKAEEVKAWLQKTYEDPATRPAYVLLLGDLEQIPSLKGTVDGCLSDYRYTLLAGNDQIPDLMIGRLPARTAEEAAYLLGKVLRHERDPFRGDEAAWYPCATGISSSASGPAGISDDKRLDSIRDYLSSLTYTKVDRLYQTSRTNTPAEVLKSLAEGRSFLTYMGHGDGTSWASTNPPFNLGHIDTVANPGRLPVIMDVSCNNGNFGHAGGDCLAERWLRVGTSDAPRGALASYSASTSTPWDPSAILGVGAVKYLAEQHCTLLGQAALGGMLHLMKEMPVSDRKVVQTMEQYVLLGDPTLRFRTAVPREIALDLPQPMFIGENRFSLTVRDASGAPAAGALVTMTDTSSGNVVASATSPATGTVELALAAPITQPTTMKLLVTGFNLAPATQELKVFPAQGPYLVASEHALDWDSDGNGRLNPGERGGVSFSLKNVGKDYSGYIRLRFRTATAGLRLWAADPGRYEYRDPFVPGNFPDRLTLQPLGPNQSYYPYRLPAVDFQVGRRLENNTPARIRLDWWCQFGRNHGTIILQVPVAAPVLKMRGLVLDDGAGNKDGHLDPGETILVKATVVNQGKEIARRINLSLATTTPSLVLEAPLASLDELAPAASAEMALRFRIPETIRGATIAALSFKLSAKNQFLPTAYVHSQIIGYRGRVLAVEDSWNALSWSLPLLSGWDYLVKKVTPAEALKLTLPQPFDLVYWDCGTNYRPLFTPEPRTWLRAWRRQGGKLLLAGSQLASNLLKNDPAFLGEVLGVREVYSTSPTGNLGRAGSTHPLWTVPNLLPDELKGSGSWSWNPQLVRALADSANTTVPAGGAYSRAAFLGECVKRPGWFGMALVDGDGQPQNGGDQVFFSFRLQDVENGNLTRDNLFRNAVAWLVREQP